MLLLPIVPTVLAFYARTGGDNSNAVYPTSSTVALAAASPRVATMAATVAGLQPPPHQVGNAPGVHIARAGKDLV